MTIKDMHYDFKKKVNKVDSEKYRNLLVPEIDWALNEGQELYIKLLLQPKNKDYLGSSITQRTLDDIYTLIRHEKDPENSYPAVNNVAQLPSDYWYYLSSYVTMSKGACLNVEGKTFIRQHDDDFERSSFDFSSFQWRTVNAVFIKDGMRFYAEKDSTINTFNISYVKKLRRIHNAEDFRDAKYSLPSNQILGIITDGGKIEILGPVVVAGDISFTVGDGTDSFNTTLTFPVGSSKTVVMDAIIAAINKDGTFEAYPSNREDYTVDIVGALPITVLTIPDTNGIFDGTDPATQIGVEVGEGSLDCELPDHTHREIVDLAVMLVTGEIGDANDYAIKQDKMKMNLNK